MNAVPEWQPKYYVGQKFTGANGIRYVIVSIDHVRLNYEVEARSSVILDEEYFENFNPDAGRF